MSIDVSELKLSYSITRLLQKLLQKNPKRESVLKKLEAQMRSLQFLAEREREVDLEAAEKLHSLLVKLLRDTAGQSAHRQRLAVLACQYFYLKKDAVPDVGNSEGLDDDTSVAKAVQALLLSQGENAVP
jgi:uncharacterized membrane protein YkvA (DUF1232 family)